ncbi:Lrp/AsnC family transcriptional regulator [Methylorubrum thiocyanatum]
MKLDRLDAKILNVLQSDPRQSAARVGDIVGLSQSAVSRRIQALVEAGVIENYLVVVSPKKVGFPIRVSLLCSLHAEVTGEQARLLDALRNDPFVARLSRVTTGDADLAFTVIAQDLDSYERHIASYQQAFSGLRIVRRDMLGDELKQGLSVPIEVTM